MRIWNPIPLIGRDHELLPRILDNTMIGESLNNVFHAYSSVRTKNPGIKYMTLVSLERELAEELIDMKLNYLQDEIQKILDKWKYSSTTRFIEDSKDGTINEAEDDAITLQHLLDQRDELFHVKDTWS